MRQKVILILGCEEEITERELSNRLESPSFAPFIEVVEVIEIEEVRES